MRTPILLFELRTDPPVPLIVIEPLLFVILPVITIPAELPVPATKMLPVFDLASPSAIHTPMENESDLFSPMRLIFPDPVDETFEPVLIKMAWLLSPVPEALSN